MSLKRFLRLSPEVNKALKLGREKSRIVVLESAVLTHGLPYPHNAELANTVEEVIRAEGAVPATVGVIDGLLRIGMDKAQLLRLCESGNGRYKRSKVKVSRRDFPHVLGRNSVDGGTTVSGTLAAIECLDLPIFVTGGIGGVHRGGELSMDISADIAEMGRNSAMVISAGVKSILDIGRTLEALESQGVCVTSFGQTQFPAFFVRNSGIPSPHSVEDLTEVVDMLKAHSLKSGILLAVPIPAEAEAKDVENDIQRALAEAEKAGICGRDVTPFVLAKVNEISAGASMKANLALLEHNAKIGAQIAVKLSETSRSSLRPLVIGGSIVDIIARAKTDHILLNGSTHTANIRLGFGGVGRNVADALGKLGCDPLFVSSVGDDALGRLVRNSVPDQSLISVREDAATAVYNVTLDKSGEAKLGLGEMEVNSLIDGREAAELMRQLNPPVVILDGNLSYSAIDEILENALKTDIPVFFEPTDVNKAAKAANSAHFSAVTYISPNLKELCRLTGVDDDAELTFEQIKTACDDLLRHVQVVLVTLGEDGVVVVRRGSPDQPLPLKNDPRVLTPAELTGVSEKRYPILDGNNNNNVVSVSGSGDCFAAGFISALLSGCLDQDKAIEAGLKAAARSIQCIEAVPDNL